MILLANLLSGLAVVLKAILDLYFIIILARVVCSWVNADPYNKIVQMIFMVTEPLLYRIRRMLPSNFGGLDFSPIIVFLVIYFLQAFLVQTISDYALVLKQQNLVL